MVSLAGTGQTCTCEMVSQSIIVHFAQNILSVKPSKLLE